MLVRKTAPMKSLLMVERELATGTCPRHAYNWLPWLINNDPSTENGVSQSTTTLSASRVVVEAPDRLQAH